MNIAASGIGGQFRPICTIDAILGKFALSMQFTANFLYLCNFQAMDAVPNSITSNFLCSPMLESLFKSRVCMQMAVKVSLRKLFEKYVNCLADRPWITAKEIKGSFNWCLFESITKMVPLLLAAVHLGNARPELDGPFGEGWGIAQPQAMGRHPQQQLFSHSPGKKKIALLPKGKRLQERHEILVQKWVSGEEEDNKDCN